jgi:signal transduction histidine kinase
MPTPVSPSAPGAAAVAAVADGADASGPRTAPALRRRRWLVVAAALLLPLALTALLHLLALRLGAAAGADLVTFTSVQRIDDPALQPPAGRAGAPVSLPHLERAGDVAAPVWLLARFTLARPADGTWVLALGHRSEVLVYLDGRLLANSAPVSEADRTPRNLRIGGRWLTANVPADWLAAGEHELAVRVSPDGTPGASLSRLLLGPAQAVEAAERPRHFWTTLRVLTALSALVIGTLLLFAWTVDRRERLYLWSAVHLLLLALLLSPYALPEPPLPAPWWRVLLDVADVLAKGLAVVVIGYWAAPSKAGVRRLAFAYIALALPVDALAAYQQIAWSDFGHPWPWWALGSRLFVLALALAVALAAVARRPEPQRLGTALLAGLALWIWADVSLFAIVRPGVIGVVDLNVVAYAGWALWVATLLHRRVTDHRRRERQLRQELAEQLLARSEQLHAQYAALQSSERARAAAAERERLLQEMHDGLGAQLASAKMLASGGQLTSAEMVDLLDGCLREMRLTVDALGVTDGDLGLLLATLRHRLAPALGAGGIVLDWRVHDTPRVPALEGSGAREFVRIVQEALTNVVHHAQASRVEVGTRCLADGRRVQVCITDDGCGMPAEPSLGRGLRGMRQRAARLGATIEWRAPPPPARGTMLVIELPLPDGAAAPA